MNIIKIAQIPIKASVVDELKSYDFINFYCDDTLEISVEDFFNNIEINKYVGITKKELQELKDNDVEYIHLFYF